MTNTSSLPDVHLDVRAAIAAGQEPLDAILEAAAPLTGGGILELTAPFNPVPLYSVMQDRGFSARTEQRGPAEWVVRFRGTGIVQASLLAEVADRHPATRPIMARHGLDMCCGGGKSVALAAAAHGLDVRALLTELQEAVGD
ncbi:MAG: DUF542 domain-containing protein [Gemmatimonadota bacterium]